MLVGLRWNVSFRSTHVTSLRAARHRHGRIAEAVLVAASAVAQSQNLTPKVLVVPVIGRWLRTLTRCSRRQCGRHLRQALVQSWIFTLRDPLYNLKSASTPRMPTSSRYARGETRYTAKRGLCRYWALSIFQAQCAALHPRKLFRRSTAHIPFQKTRYLRGWRLL